MLVDQPAPARVLRVKRDVSGLAEPLPPLLEMRWWRVLLQARAAAAAQHSQPKCVPRGSLPGGFLLIPVSPQAPHLSLLRLTAAVTLPPMESVSPGAPLVVQRALAVAARIVVPITASMESASTARGTFTATVPPTAATTSACAPMTTSRVFTPIARTATRVFLLEESANPNARPNRTVMRHKTVRTEGV